MALFLLTAEKFDRLPPTPEMKFRQPNTTTESRNVEKSRATFSIKYQYQFMAFA